MFQMDDIHGMTERVLVLGAGGVVGRTATAHLAASRPDATVVAADVDESASDRLTDLGENVQFERVDVTERADLEATVADADCVVNCVGPSYRFATTVLDAAIAAGTDYVDVCDDYDVTEPLLERHDRAVDAGVTAVVGLGASPGVTNVLAARAREEMTTVDAVSIRVTRSILAEAGPAIPYHLFNSWLGPVPAYAGDERRTVEGLRDGAETVHFPDPFDERTVYHFGHPETVTIPRSFESVEDVSVKGTFVPAAFRERLLEMYDLGLLEDDPVTVDGVEVAPVDFAAALLERVGTRVAMGADDLPTGGAVVVEVEGIENGRPTVRRYAGTSTMQDATSTAASVGAELALEDRLRVDDGVWSPEEAVPPAEFVRRLQSELDLAFWTGTYSKQPVG